MAKKIEKKTFPEHQLEIVVNKDFTKYAFARPNGSYEAMAFTVMHERTIITGDWGSWMLIRPVDIKSRPDRQYLSQKMTAVPHQANKSMQTYWFNVLMDGLEAMHELYVAGKYTADGEV